MRALTFGLAATFSLAAGQLVQAAVLTHVQSLGVPDAATAGQQGRTMFKQSVDLLFAQFDPALGTLTDVDIWFNARIDTPATLIWDSEIDENRFGRYSIKIGYWVIAPDANPSFWHTYGWNWNNFTVQADSDAAADFAGSDSLKTTTWTKGQISGGPPKPTSLDAYLGTGSLGMTFKKATYSDPDRVNFATRFDHTGETSAEVSLKYTYTPVPEPSTFGIWALLACLGLAVARRPPRRKLA